jgi:phosphinothricin acetyltransferase
MECRAVTVRAGSEIDLAQITEIYNHYVETTPVTLDTVPFTREGRRSWFRQYTEDGPYRVFVADFDGLVVGYATSSRLEEKLAYATSIETNFFSPPAYGAHGLARSLYDRLFEALREEDLHRAYAAVTLPNEASLNLHQSLGFETTGVFKEVGRKFDKYWDVLWLSRKMP